MTTTKENKMSTEQIETAARAIRALPFTATDGDMARAVIAAIHPTVTDADLRMDSDGCWGYEPANGTLIESADGSAWFWDDDEGWRPLPTNSSCSLRGPATVLHMGGAA